MPKANKQVSNLRIQPTTKLQQYKLKSKKLEKINFSEIAKEISVTVVC
jgi:hypothetical protein